MHSIVALSHIHPHRDNIFRSVQMLTFTVCKYITILFLYILICLAEGMSEEEGKTLLANHNPLGETGHMFFLDKFWELQVSMYCFYLSKLRKQLLLKLYS